MGGWATVGLGYGLCALVWLAMWVVSLRRAGRR